MEERPIQPSLLMQNGAITAAHSHRRIDANNNTQRLNFTMGDFGLLFWNWSIAIDEQDGKRERSMHI